MKKLLWVVLFVVLVVLGLVFLAFTSTGNDLLKPYVKAKLEKELGLPVEVEKFRLDSGNLTLDFGIDQQANVHVGMKYRLANQAFDGVYQIDTEGLNYQKMQIKRLELRGHFKGKAKDISVDGNGTFLGSNITYGFKIVDDTPQEAVLEMKGIMVSEGLALMGYPALANGTLDIEVNMPNIGDKTAKGYSLIVLHPSYFDRDLIAKLYGYTLPEKSAIRGTITSKLEGKEINIDGDIQSDLFSMQIKDGVLDTTEKALTASVNVDVNEMRIFTQNKLAGQFKAEGTLQRKEGALIAKGESHSLGGNLNFSIEQKRLTATFENVALEKILAMAKQPSYASGNVNGEAVFDIKEKQGNYTLRIDRGVFGSVFLEKLSNYRATDRPTFTFASEGNVEEDTLKANVSVKSTLADITLPTLEYNLEQKAAQTPYAVLVHDIYMWMPQSNSKASLPVRVEGKLMSGENLVISGIAKGLGADLSFSYDKQSVKLDAPQLDIEKLLALAGVPVYVNGSIESHVLLTNQEPLEGNFILKGTQLNTDPAVMKQEIGDPLAVKISVDTSGVFKNGKGEIKGAIKSGIGNLTLDHITADMEQQIVKGGYVLEIPSLEKIQKVINQKLYGALTLIGSVESKKKVLHMTGKTTSLGGAVDVAIAAENANATLAKVPLANIMTLLGHKQIFLGEASGKMQYNLKQKSGTADLNIDGFQIKSNQMTQLIAVAIGKDPSRVIFSSSTFHADIKNNITTYELHAKGTRTSIDITEGKLDKTNQTNNATFKFVYEKYTVNGKITGSTDDPKVTLDTSAILKDKIDEKLQEKLDKALGGEVGNLLKGLKF